MLRFAFFVIFVDDWRFTRSVLRLFSADDIVSALG
jgi:hypothetical protein